jgi:hypothetical protein
MYGTDPDRLVSAIQKEGMVAIKVAVYLQQMRDLQNQLSGEGGEDPLIGLKRMEIEQRAKADQAKISVDQQRLTLDQQKLQNNNQINQQRLRLQEIKTMQPQGARNAA